MGMMKVIKIFLIFCVLGLVGCQSPPPVVEYTIAEAAMKAAIRANAMRFAPGPWTKAEQAYQEGKNHFQRERYKAARKSFQQAYLYAEQSENIARIERLNQGEPP